MVVGISSCDSVGSQDGHGNDSAKSRTGREREPVGRLVATVELTATCPLAAAVNSCKDLSVTGTVNITVIALMTAAVADSLQ